MSEDAPVDSLMVVERAARPRNEVATGVSRPGETTADLSVDTEQVFDGR